MKKLSIRIRLTALFILLQSGIIISFSYIIYNSFRTEALDALDEILIHRVAAFEPSLNVETGKADTDFEDDTNLDFLRGSCIQVYDDERNIIYQQNLPPIAAIAIPESSNFDPSPYVRLSMQEGEKRIRCVWKQMLRDGKTFYILMTGNEKSISEDMGRLFKSILSTAVLIFFASSIIIWFVVGACLRPLVRISEKARHISVDQLDARLEVHNPHDEIGRLTGTLNGMIERLQHSFASIRRFTSDASHELRTPLSSMRCEIEVALQMERTPGEYSALLQSLLEEVQRMTTMCETLLMLARLDTPQVAKYFEHVEVAPLLQDTVDKMSAVAQAEGKDISATLKLGGVRVCGVKHLIKQSFFNILDNAIKHGGRAISVSHHADDRYLHIEFRDDGGSIPPEELENIFKPLIKIDRSRSKRSSGCGLGLTLTKRYVQLYGGDIRVASSPVEGTRFTISLPLVLA